MIEYYILHPIRSLGLFIYRSFHLPYIPLKSFKKIRLEFGANRFGNLCSK